MTDSLAIIVLHWHDEARTSQCLELLRQWRFSDWQIYLIQNGAKFSQSKMYQDLPIHWIETFENKGFAGGNNLGIKKALADGAHYILLLNSDVQVDDGTIGNLMEALRHNPACYAIGPVLIEGQEKHVGGRNIGLFRDTRISAQDWDTDQIFAEVDYVPGTVLMCPSATFREIGLLDEQYFFSGEIADLGMRIKLQGKKSLIQIGSQASHSRLQDEDEKWADLKLYYSLRNRFLFVRKFFPARVSKYLFHWSLVALRQLLGAILMFDLGKARSTSLALRDGLFGRFGNRNHYFQNGLS